MDSRLQMPAEFSIESRHVAGVPAGVLRFVGSKPVPARVLIEAGFSARIEPMEVVSCDGAGAIHALEPEGRYSFESASRSSPAAIDRFHADHRRFPVAAYEAESLLWKSDAVWRQWSTDERCQLIGIPPGHGRGQRRRKGEAT